MQSFNLNDFITHFFDDHYRLRLFFIPLLFLRFHTGELCGGMWSAGSDFARNVIIIPVCQFDGFHSELFTDHFRLYTVLCFIFAPLDFTLQQSSTDCWYLAKIVAAAIVVHLIGNGEMSWRTYEVINLYMSSLVRAIFESACRGGEFHSKRNRYT